MKRFIDYILEGQVDGLKDVKVIEKGEPLFMRKNMEEELEYLRN